MINKIFKYFSNLFNSVAKNKPEVKAVQIDDFPEDYKTGIIYIIGEDDPWYVSMLCPCGCGEAIRLCLQEDVTPSWKLILHDDKTVSLRPSVWRTRGCRSHFFVKHGNIDWCNSYAS